MNIGGGIFMEDGLTFLITNSILWNNTAATDPQVSGPAGSFAIEFSDVEGGFPGPGNIDADPLLLAPAGDDLHLRLGSPCIDAGTDQIVGAPTIDFDGDPRPLDGDLDAVNEHCAAPAAVVPSAVNSSLAARAATRASSCLIWLLRLTMFGWSAV